MKKILFLSITLLAAGNALVVQSPQALISGAVRISMSATQPNVICANWWSAQPQSHWGAIPPKGLMGGAFAPSAQGAINFLDIPQTPFYKI